MKAESHKVKAENLFVGGGEIGVLVRSHDWSQTPLGAVETWSESLKTAVQILLTEFERVNPPEKTQLEANLPPSRPSTDALRQAAQADAFRVKLTNALRPLTDANQIQAIAARILGESLDASRVIYIEVLPGGKQVLVHKNYTNGVACLSGLYHLEDFGRNLMDDHRAGRTAIVPDVANYSKYTASDKVRYRSIDIAAHIDVPLIKNKQFVALLAVHQANPREWSQDEVKRVEETAQQTWAAVERAKAEAALRQSEARFRTLISASSNVLYRMNADWSEMYELQGGDFIADTSEPIPDWMQKYIHPDDQARVLEAIEVAIGNKRLFELEHRVRQVDGTLGWTYSRAVPLLDSAGEIIEWFGEASDISDRKRIEQEREQLLAQEQAAREAAESANRIKDEFLAVLSHELRSPLNPILGWTRLLQNGKLSEARKAEALKTIERNANLQTQLIEDLLDISRIMQGKLSLIVAPVNLTFVISAAVETVHLAAQAKNIGIALDLDFEIAPVSGDAARLQQVMWNLLTNAVKFTPNSGQVTVELRSFDGLAQIRVIDTGKGINPQFLPHVFEYFRQEDSSTTRKFGGLGLGLAIVRQIVEMHGGMVMAESGGENQGATFIVQLPLIQQANKIASEPIHTPIEASVPLEGVQILLVDDELDTREFQAFVLSQSGANVTSVVSGLEALQALDLFTFDVLVSDIGMAQMDGYMLMQQIRSRLANQGGSIRAIALTAYAADIDQQRALQVGFQTHITKPVEPEELVRAIANLLESN